MEVAFIRGIGTLAAVKAGGFGWSAQMRLLVLNDSGPASLFLRHTGLIDTRC